MGERRLSLLVSPGFLAGLCLLLLNDFALKHLFHNWFTGKLSDFAGLFIFPLFWSALFPHHRRAIHLLVSISFAFWKSAYSQPLIDAWNGFAILPLERTVDASDLFALAVLPLSYIYGERVGRERQYRQERRYRLAPHFIAGVSLFAFTATSFRTEFPYDNKYFFSEPAIELTRKMYHLSHLDSRYRVSFCYPPRETPNNIEVSIPAKFCFDDVEATIGVSEEQGQSVISLKKMHHDCPEGRDDKRQLQAIFEKEFIEKLKQATLEPPSSVANESPSPQPRPQLRGRGQLYLVSVGEVPHVEVEELAAHFRRHYGVPIKVLPKLAITDEMRQANLQHGRLTAGGMLVSIANKYPKLFQKTESVVIGITEHMTLEQMGNQIYNFSLDLEGRFAVVATEGIIPSMYCEPANKELLDARLRKVIAKNIGTLYFRLPRSDNPQSVLYTNVGCVDELDNQGEDF